MIPKTEIGFAWLIFPSVLPICLRVSLDSSLVHRVRWFAGWRKSEKREVEPHELLGLVDGGVSGRQEARNMIAAHCLSLSIEAVSEREQQDYNQKRIWENTE